MLIVLSVNIAQQRRQLPQQRNRHRAAAQKRARLAARQDLALDQQLAILDGEARRLEQRMYIRAIPHVEDTRHPPARLAGPDHLRRRPPAQQQAEGIHHDGLAAARLARQQIQSRMKPHADAIHHGIVLDQQLQKHGCADYSRVLGDRCWVMAYSSQTGDRFATTRHPQPTTRLPPSTCFRPPHRHLITSEVQPVW